MPAGFFKVSQSFFFIVIWLVLDRWPKALSPHIRCVETVLVPKDGGSSPFHSNKNGTLDFPEEILLSQELQPSNNLKIWRLGILHFKGCSLCDVLKMPPFSDTAPICETKCILVSKKKIFSCLCSKKSVDSRSRFSTDIQRGCRNT